KVRGDQGAGEGGEAGTGQRPLQEGPCQVEIELTRGNKISPGGNPAYSGEEKDNAFSRGDRTWTNTGCASSSAWLETTLPMPPVWRRSCSTSFAGRSGKCSWFPPAGESSRWMWTESGSSPKRSSVAMPKRGKSPA